MIIHGRIKIFGKNKVSLSFLLVLTINCIYLTLTGNLMPLKSSLSAKSLSAFKILLGFRSTGWMYPTKHHLKHPLPSIF